jgi:hypothetical protein
VFSLQISYIFSYTYNFTRSAIKLDTYMNSRFFFYSFELNFCLGGVGLGVVFLFKTNYLFPPFSAVLAC